MKFVKGIVITNINDKKVAICTGEASLIFTGFINLNESAYIIWQDIEQGLTEEEIAKHLTSNYYDIDFNEALKYTKEFIAELKKKGILLD